MAFNRLPAVKQTTSINSSDTALAFLSLSHPRVCVSMWFKPSLVQYFCLPTGYISCLKGQSQCCLLQHDLLLFIISLVSISIYIFTPVVFLMKPFFHTLSFCHLKYQLHVLCGLWYVCVWVFVCSQCVRCQYQCGGVSLRRIMITFWSPYQKTEDQARCVEWSEEKIHAKATIYCTSRIPSYKQRCGYKEHIV